MIYWHLQKNRDLSNQQKKKKSNVNHIVLRQKLQLPWVCISLP